MREAEASKIVRVNANASLKGDTRERVPTVVGELRDAARVVNYLLDRTLGPGQAQTSTPGSGALGSMPRRTRSRSVGSTRPTARTRTPVATAAGMAAPMVDRAASTMWALLALRTLRVPWAAKRAESLPGTSAPHGMSRDGGARWRPAERSRGRRCLTWLVASESGGRQPSWLLMRRRVWGRGLPRPPPTKTPRQSVLGAALSARRGAAWRRRR
jgi:hypothetical protein